MFNLMLRLVLFLSMAAGVVGGPTHPVLARMSPAASAEGRTPTGEIALSNVVSVSAGGFHTCAVVQGGAVLCWGLNLYGQLGDGTTTLRTLPAAVVGLDGPAVAVAAGAYHTCALLANGQVRCWGRNNAGQLGDGTAVSRSTPVPVSGLAAVAAVTAGGDHTCALTTGGGVYCWGANWYGQLGDGTTTSRSTPVSVAGLGTGVTSLSAGRSHTCAVSQEKGAQCWGFNGDGQLGNNSTAHASVPTDVSGLSSGVVAVTAGGHHSCVLMQDGGAQCWGFNAFGQLGDGTTENNLVPTEVEGLQGQGLRLAAGRYHTCALTSAGVQCWGWNEHGAVGDGSVQNRPNPQPVSGLTGQVAAVTAGERHTCALLTSGELRCWGGNSLGQLGLGWPLWRTAPVDSPVLINTAQVVAGETHACAVTASGEARCWGNNDVGQLGDGTNIARSEPTPVQGLSSGISQVATYSGHTCALTMTGGVKCWGNNEFGQLGNGTTVSSSTPVDVVGLQTSVLSLAVGRSHTCALLTNGGVKCWGYNGVGQLGDGTAISRSTPVDVLGLTSGAVAIATGGQHTCAVTSEGAVKCWGWNRDGQVGDGTTVNRNSPVAVSGLSSNVSAVAAGASHTCALLASGQARCWGSNENGQLGDGTTTRRLTPVAVAGSHTFTALALGGSHTCALTTGRSIKCWGRNTSGQLGNGSLEERRTPADVQGLANNAMLVTAGRSFSCALASRRAKCWGADDNGQLGIGLPLYRAVPASVLAAAPRLRLSYDSGRPGSFFTLTGENFPSGTQAVVSVNGRSLSPSIASDVTGQFVVFLSTTGAPVGRYLVRVDAQVSAEAEFALSAQAPLRSQEGGGVVLPVSDTPSPPPARRVYLPSVQR